MTNEVAKKKQLPAFLVLTIICLVAALALAATNAITKGPIEEHAAAARAANFSSVLSASAYEEVEREGANDGVVLVEAWNKGAIVDALSGATVTSDAVIEAVNAAVKAEDLTASAKGFQSDVNVAVTLDEQGAIASLTIDSAEETQGLGTRCAEDEAFIGQFVGKTAPFVRQEGKIGYCVSASATGYGGDVAVTLGVNMDGEIVGAKIGDNNFRETDTIGGKWLAEDKVEQFIGINLTDGGAIDTISGATVTSDAVKAAANKAADALRAHLGIESDTPVFGEPKPVEYADSVAAGEYTATADGFQSKVKVTFTVDENSTITALTLDTTGETPSYGVRCTEDASFAAQFVGKAVPVTEFDVLSGATITSNAVVKAINSIAVAGEEPAVETSAEEVPAVETPAGTAYEASAQGFQSEVKVTVTVDEAGVITGIAVDSTGETQGLGTRCGEDEAFLSQFVGKTAPVEADVLSGATVTSNAVIAAVNAALPVAEVEAAPAGTAYEASAQGFQSEVKVTVTVDEAGVITGVTVDASGETQGLGTRCGEDEAFLNQFVGKTAPVEADVLSGATVTSNAVIAAVNAALPAVEAAPAGTAYEASAQGFQSEVKVTVTVDEAGVITGVTVDSTGETQGFGTRCGEDEAFLSQFVGKTAPVEADVLSGATVTSNAVIAAVNAALPAVEAAPAGTAYEASAQGFQSEVKVTVTVDEAGVITGIAVDSTGETQGFGTRCGEDEAFLSQFVGKTAPVEADVLSGATVTSNAVIAAVNAAMPAVEAAPAGTAYEASAQGFQSEVKVTVTVDEAGVITSIAVDSTGETQGFGTRCGEDEAFLSQFIGKTAPVEADVLSGATVTSNAVIAAVNAAMPAAEVEAAPAADAMVVTVPAFGNQEITVTVTLDENGNVATLVVDAATQTPGLGLKCAEDEFVNQFIGAAGPFVLGENVDAVSYATITSEAVVDAVNSMLPTQDMSVTDEAVAAYDPAAEQTVTVPAFGNQNITVTVTLDENGNVATLVVDAATQTPGLGLKCAEDEFVNQFIGAAGPFVLGENVDAVSYATITSQAVIDAVNQLLGK